MCGSNAAFVTSLVNGEEMADNGLLSRQQKVVKPVCTPEVIGNSAVSSDVGVRGGKYDWGFGS